MATGFIGQWMVMPRRPFGDQVLSLQACPVLSIRLIIHWFWSFTRPSLQA